MFGKGVDVRVGDFVNCGFCLTCSNIHDSAVCLHVPLLYFTHGMRLLEVAVALLAFLKNFPEVVVSLRMILGGCLFLVPSLKVNELSSSSLFPHSFKSPLRFSFFSAMPNVISYSRASLAFRNDSSIKDSSLIRILEFSFDFA